MHTKERQDIQDFWVIGINYKKTDASVRGMFAINNEQYEQLLATAPQYGLTDFFILSTCNRTEIYGFADSDAQLINFICKACIGDAATFAKISYAKSGCDAMAHFYRVAAGLDSQILGDYEILGQIKNAVKQAKGHGAIGAFTDRLINSVLQASKAVKTYTDLSGGTVSVSFAAVQYIKDQFENILNDGTALKDKKIVLLGTGKIGHITCRNLVDYLGTKNITLINRTEKTAADLAGELNLNYAPFSALGAELKAADIILVSTNATEPVIHRHHLENTGKKLVIDLSVPSNVAADAQNLPGITFADVDMLSKIKDETLQKRQAEVPKALDIISQHIIEFKEWYTMRNKHVPVLKEVKDKLKGIQIDAELLDMAAHTNEEKIQKVINSLATRMRSNYTPGCHYIQAINDYIA